MIDSTTKIRIALIGYAGIVAYTPAHGFDENTDFLPFLQEQLDITAEVWDDPNVKWEQYDVALLKTPWDYSDKYGEFKLFLDNLQKMGIALINSYSMVRWNMDKHYLQEMINEGFNVIPSVFIDKGKILLPDNLFEELRTEKIIIKPCVGGGAKNTLVIDKSYNNDTLTDFIRLVSNGDYIAQPMMEEIQNGEWSFIFFNEKYSHTVIKRPKEGDYRVQQIHGGSIENIVPDKNLLKDAASFVKRFAVDSLYARVDGIIINNTFMLMELELIEPFLYLAYQSEAKTAYRKALIEQLKTIKSKR